MLQKVVTMWWCSSHCNWVEVQINITSFKGNYYLFSTFTLSLFMWSWNWEAQGNASIECLCWNFHSRKIKVSLLCYWIGLKTNKQTNKQKNKPTHFEQMIHNFGQTHNQSCCFLPFPLSQWYSRVWAKFCQWAVFYHRDKMTP